MIGSIPFRRPSFANSLILRIGLLILLALAVFAAGSYRLILQPAVQGLAQAQMGQVSEQLEARALRLFDTVEVTLRISRDWGTAEGNALPQLQAFNDFFLPRIANHREISSAILADEEGREFFLTRAADGRWINRLSDPRRWGRHSYWLTWSADRQLERVDYRETDYDARQRPWFRGVMEQGGDGAIFWTAPYTFYTTGQPGVTAAVRWTDAAGRRHVVAHDVGLLKLSQFTTSLAVGNAGRAGLFLGDGRIVALPRYPQFADAAAQEASLLRSAADLGLAEIAAGQAGELEPGIHGYRFGGEPWFALFRPIPAGNRQLWLGVFAPEAEFVPGSRRDLLFLALIALLALLAGIFVAVRVARQFGRPLAALARESARIGRLELADPVRVRAPWREVKELALAQETMRQRLQEANAALESKVEERTRALARQFALLEALLDTIPNPIFYKGADARFLGCNRAYEAAFGTDRRRFVGKRVLDLDYLPEGDRLAYQAEDERVIAEAGRVVREVPMVLADGERHDTLYSVTGFRNPDGSPGGLIGVIVDITALKNAEREAHQARLAAEAAAAAKADFLANMSHEIRTPMNAIVGMTHLALQTELSARQRNYLNKVDAAAQGLLGIINDILDFSKIEAGMMRLERADFSLDQVLGHVADLSALKAREKGLELLFDVAPDVPPRLRGDALRLGQVLVNLVGNALKFTERGEVTVTVTRADADGPGIRLAFAVRDTGVGIGEQEQATLFAPFTQADTSTTRRYGGTGLGLSICKRIVELMDGDITVASVPGQGSCFTFTARFEPGESAASAPRREMPEPARPVLVADDNPAARDVFLHMLSRLGFPARAVASGEEAIAELDAAEQAGRPYGLLVADWQMPGLDGVETVRRLRADRAIAATPAIVMTTAYDRDELAEALAGLGVGAILPKPVTPSALHDSIATALHGEGSRPGPGAPLAAAADLAGLRVLLVEDNEVNRELAEELLAAAGVRVAAAADGVEALERLAADGPWDAVLMDCHMPVMDGFEATRRLRRDPRLAALPVIAMTAGAQAADRERCLACGMDDHIAKPVDVRELYAKLRRWARPTAAPALDREGALKRLGGNGDMYRRLLQRFAEDQVGAAEGARAALAAGDPATARRLVHTLKGLAGNIGATALEDAAGAFLAALGDPAADPEAPLQALAASLAAALAAAPQAAEPAPAPAAPPPPPPATRPLADRLRGLLALLAADDALATRALEDLRPDLEQTLGADEAAALTREIARYDFDSASRRLRGHAPRLGTVLD